MNYLAIFNETLNDLMLKHNLKMSLLSGETGVARSAISKWFDETRWPSVQSLVKLADYFNCSIDFLFGLSKRADFVKSGCKVKFFDRFRERSAAKEFSFYYIAKQLKIGNSAVSKWEKSKRYPQMEVLINLSKLLDCSIDYLIGRADTL